MPNAEIGEVIAVTERYVTVRWSRSVVKSHKYGWETDNIWPVW